ncbi:MAG: NHL repeat-containing protein [Pirellulales bacterium]
MHREKKYFYCALISASSTYMFPLMFMVVMGIAVSQSIRAQDAAGDIQDLSNMHYPLGVAAKKGGELFIADRLLPGIWKVANGRTVRFVAGAKKFRSPLSSIRAVAVGPNGDIFAADSGTREIYSVSEDGSPSPLTGGKIGIPMDMAANSRGQLFVSDLETHQIWKIDVKKGDVEQYISLPTPRGLFVDQNDQLWVVSTGQNQVIRLDQKKEITSVVKNQPFDFPQDIVVDSSGVAYVTDNYKKCVWRIPVNGKPEVWAGGKPLKGPVGIALQQESILVADPKAKQIFKIDHRGSEEGVVTSALQE